MPEFHAIQKERANVNMPVLFSELKTAVTAIDSEGQVTSLTYEGGTVYVMVYGDFEASDLMTIEGAITDHNPAAFFNDPVAAARQTLSGYDYAALATSLDEATDWATAKPHVVMLANLLRSWAVYTGLQAG